MIETAGARYLWCFHTGFRKLDLFHVSISFPFILTHETKNRYTGRTTTTSGFRPVSHADFFVPAHSRYAAYYGQVEKPIYLNKARRLVAVVETCPPSSVWATTEQQGGHMSALTIGSSAIRQINGLYSLNDLHKASGEEQRHQPRYFLAIQQTADLISEIENSEKSLFKPIEVFQGRNGGTYACKELVIAYAAWISPAFHLKVIRVFLGATRPALPVPSRPVYISAMQQTDINSRAHVIAQQYYSKFRAELMADFAAGKVQDVETWEPEITPAFPKPEARPQINLFDPDEFMRVREIACKYLEDVAEKAKGGKVTPSLEIPDDVLAGIVAMQMWKNNFTLAFSHEGKATIWKTPDPFDAVTRIIADPGWANLEKIRQVFDACMTALSNRLGVGGTK